MALDMTQGKPLKLLTAFALPLILSSIFQQLYTLGDSVIVGRLLGEEAFAAIASSSYLDWFPLSMLLGLSQGFGVVLAQRFGAKDEGGFRRALAMSLLLALALAALLTVLGVCFQGPFLRALRTPAPLYAYTADYLRVLWLGLAVTAVQNIYGTALRALGDSRTPLVSLVLSTLLNIALDYLFMAPLGMGVQGAALATVLARGASVAYCAWRLRRTAFATPSRADFRPHRPTIRALLRLGLPPMFSFAVTATGELAVQATFNLQGVLFVTGVTAAKRYYSLLNVIGSSLEGALATFVGQNTGARRMRRVMDGVRTATWLGALTAVLTAGLAILFRRQLILFFLPEASAELLRIGMDALFAEAILLVSLTMLCLHRAALQGMGNALVPMLSGFMELALRYACVLLLPLLFARESLYFIDAITWTVTGAFVVIVYYATRRRLCAALEKQGEATPKTLTAP